MVGESDKKGLLLIKSSIALGFSGIFWSIILREFLVMFGTGYGFRLNLFCIVITTYIASLFFFYGCIYLSRIWKSELNSENNKILINKLFFGHIISQLVPYFLFIIFFSLLYPIEMLIYRTGFFDLVIIFSAPLIAILINFYGRKKVLTSISQKSPGPSRQEPQYSEQKAIVEKVKAMLEVSTRINLDRMQDALNIDKKVFNDKIFEWARQFGFTIDGDYLIINKDTISAFIDALDRQFAQWGKAEATKEGKI